MIAPNQQHRILWLPNEERMFDDDSPSRSSAGVRINSSNAHQVAAVFSCLRVVAETVAGLPLHVLERSAGGGKRIAKELPLYKQLHSQPNGWQTSFEWREQAVMHVGLWGNAFSELKAGQIVPLHPSRMKIERIENGNLRYKYREEKGTDTPYNNDQILQIRGPSDDGVNGLSIVEECKDAIALARACELHGARFFAAGARPGFVLSTEGQLNAEAREALRSQWDRRHGGVGNSHNTAVLTGGLKPYDIPQASNTDSQFIELRRYQLEEIARLFRIPGSRLGLAPDTPEADIAFVTHCIMPWLRRFESAFTRDLIGDDDRYIVEFDVRGLLRGDAASRSSFYRAMWDIGVVSTNDIRATENLDPVEGGDVRYRPLNMGTLGENPTATDVLAQQQPGSGIDGQAVEGGLDAAAAEEPVTPSEPEAPQVADVSLNGAQITGLIAILSQVPAGLLTKEGAAALIAASFPSISDAQVTAILAGVVAGNPAGSVQPQQAAPAPAAPLSRSLPESRALTVSIDFDRTFAADPQMWGEFAKQAVADGNTVVMISRRPESDREEVISSLGDYAESFSQVLLVGGDTLKADAADEAGIKVDVWVDDSPQFIRSLEARAEPDAVDADAVLRCVRILRSVQAKFERRDCGTGAGGFKPGNKCSGGGSGGGSDSGGSGSGGGYGSVSMTPSDGYRKDALTKAADAAKQGDKREIVSYIQHRQFRDSDSDGPMAMIEHIESKSSTESMYRAMESGNSWQGTAWESATDEWSAAERLGGNGSTSKTTKELLLTSSQLSDSDVSAFAARREFAVAALRAEHGDEVTLYRGVKGAQAKKIRESEQDDIDLGVRSLSSFATSKTSAAGFAGKNGVVVEVKVPVEDAWMVRNAMPRRMVNNFSDDAGEVVLLNKGKTRKARVVR